MSRKMPRHHRKSHRKVHRKSHKKAHRKAHRKSHRKTRRQHGGGSCANVPYGRESFQQQRGGMAPIAAGDVYLLDAAARAQAGVGPLDHAFAELPSIPRQAGGRRRSHRRRSHRRRSHRRQHGGMAPFASTGVYNPMSAKYAGENDQIFTEGSINPAFGIHGAQQ